MKTKQIKTFLLAFAVIASSFVGTIPFADTTYAAKCPDNLKLHDDNICWAEEDTGAAKSCTGTGRGSTTCRTCPVGSQKSGDRCIKYTRSDKTPLNDDGTTAKMSCPDGLVWHSSDNKCWKEEKVGDAKNCPTTGRGAATCKPCPEQGTLERDGECIKYTETDTNPAIGPGGPTTEEDKKAARDALFDECKKSGKTDAECNTQADQARKQCEQEVAMNNANYADCMAKKSSIKNGECEDGSTPDPRTGKCADGSDPKVAGRDGTGKNCGQAETILITCNESGVGAIGSLLKIGVTVLSVLIGVAAVGGLAWASILYAKAEDNEGSVKEARELIRNIVIGILLYGFMIAIVNWLVPGGVIG